jgi:hypothetical protein
LPALRLQLVITTIGFLLLAALVGVVGLAAIKLTPMYIKNMTLSRILQDLQGQVQGEVSAQSIRTAIDKRLEIETMDLPKEAVKISQSKVGYNVHITYENRAPYLAGIYLLLEFDKQVEIKK